MNILFVIDRVELKYFEFNNLVTNFWMIKSLLERGCNVEIATIDMLGLDSGGPFAHTYKTYVKDDNIFYDKESYSKAPISCFEGVIFRPDPPVDIDYINATYIFDFIDDKQTVLINNTRSIRDFNEKLHAHLFGSLMPYHIVTSNYDDIYNFLLQCREIILKPLNQCFGAGVMYLKLGDKNTSVIINQMTQNGKHLVMVQAYIPEAQDGDKRVLLLGGKVLPYCVRKIPSHNDFKFCEHNDKNILKDKLSREEINNFTKVAQFLNDFGIPMAGLDVIDGKIIEVNVTSPCYFIKEINNYFGCKLEDEITDFVISYIREKTSTSISS